MSDDNDNPLADILGALGTLLGKSAATVLKLLEEQQTTIFALRRQVEAGDALVKAAREVLKVVDFNGDPVEKRWTRLQAAVATYEDRRRE